MHAKPTSANLVHHVWLRWQQRCDSMTLQHQHCMSEKSKVYLRKAGEVVVVESDRYKPLQYKPIASVSKSSGVSQTH